VRGCSLDLELAGQRREALASRQLELQVIAYRHQELAGDSLRAAQRLALTAIRAPAAATVLTDRVEARAGDQVQAGAVLLELAPLDSWYAEVQVREQDVARVRPGQSARLFVEAFPHLEYKVFRGRVESVALEPAATGGYRSRVLVEDPAVVDDGRSQALAYGMAAEARIVVAQGRIVVLLWRHLLRRLGPAARQPLTSGGREA